MYKPTLVVLLCLVAPAAGQDVKGTIKKVDLETGVLLVKQFVGGAEQELSLAGRDIVVSNAIGQAAQLGDLHVGSRVVLKMTNDFVTAIKLDGPAIWGTLRKIDVEARTIHLEDAVRTHVIVLPETARIVLDGEEKPLAKVKIGLPAQVVFTPDEKTILQLATGKGISTRDPHRKWVRLRATVLESDAQAKTLKAVLHPTGEPMTMARLVAHPNVAIHYLLNLRDVGEGQLADLKIGPVNAILVLDAETQIVEGIEVDLPAYPKRKIVAIDPQTKTIKIEEEKKKTRELPFDAAVQVLLVNGKDRGQVSDIRVGQTATLALSPDRSRVTVVHLHSR